MLHDICPPLFPSSLLQAQSKCNGISPEELHQPDVQQNESLWKYDDFNHNDGNEYLKDDTASSDDEKESSSSIHFKEDKWRYGQLFVAQPLLCLWVTTPSEQRCANLHSNDGYSAISKTFNMDNYARNRLDPITQSSAIHREDTVRIVCDYTSNNYLRVRYPLELLSQLRMRSARDMLKLKQRMPSDSNICNQVTDPTQILFSDSLSDSIQSCGTNDEIRHLGSFNQSNEVENFSNSSVSGNEIGQYNNLAALRLKATLSRKRPRPLQPEAATTSSGTVQPREKPSVVDTLDSLSFTTPVCGECVDVRSVGLPPELSTKRSSMCVPPPCPDDILITFLGTGSAAPSRHRANSCILIKSPVTDILAGNQSFPSATFASIMLDVGEGAASQLYYSASGDPHRLCSILKGLRIVWVSHHHADHHCGLSMLIEARAHFWRNYDATSTWEPLVVIASQEVCDYHEFISCASGLDDQLIFVTTSAVTKWTNKDIYQASGGILLALQNVPVRHCRLAFAVILHFSHKHYKFVYSGDCRPCDALVRAGIGCDLLIHEATFDDTMSDDALKKNHCTTSEAMSISSNMLARNTVLTHFSQRYPNSVQSFVDTVASSNISNANVYPFAVAYDFLHFCFPSQVSCLASMSSFLVSLFKSDSDDNA